MSLFTKAHAKGARDKILRLVACKNNILFFSKRIFLFSNLDPRIGYYFFTTKSNLNVSGPGNEVVYILITWFSI